MYFCPIQLTRNTVRAFILVLFLVSLIYDSFSQNRPNHCGTTSYYQYQLSVNPDLANIRQDLEIKTHDFVKANRGTGSKEIVVIPVVVHVIYYNAVQNISDAQVLSQIEVLNEDYRRLNADTTNTPSLFTSVAADCQIQFCLAAQDPNGNWTNGITRTQTTKTSFDINTDEAKYTSTGGHDIWDRNKYLNIWVVPSIRDGSYTGILGYAQLPGGGASTDGVVIQYSNFGRIGNLSPYYNLGRTVTHEVGHWFNLYHVWGDDGTGCWGSDYVDDTPNQADENYNCPSFPEPSCNNTSDMYSNYMDYTDDDCMNIFTEGQKLRMWATINNYRSSLKTSPGCLVNSVPEVKQNRSLVNIFPNPAVSSVLFNFDETFSGLISVYSIQGLLIGHYTLNSTKDFVLDVNSWQSGLYVAIIRNSAYVEVKKIEILK